MSSLHAYFRLHKGIKIQMLAFSCNKELWKDNAFGYLNAFFQLSTPINGIEEFLGLRFFNWDI